MSIIKLTFTTRGIDRGTRNFPEILLALDSTTLVLFTLVSDTQVKELGMSIDDIIKLLQGVLGVEMQWQTERTVDLRATEIYGTFPIVKFEQNQGFGVPASPELDEGMIGGNTHTWS